MNRKLIVAILLVSAVPVAQAQNPRVSKAEAQKVVTIISGDKAKTQTYCEIQKLSEQIEQAYEKKDNKMADELSQKIDKLEETLGPEYVALWMGFRTSIRKKTSSLRRLCRYSEHSTGSVRGKSRKPESASSYTRY